MSLLYYNGVLIGVNGHLSTTEWRRTIEYDGPTVLGVRHNLRVRGIYNPQSMSYGFLQGQDPPLPFLAPGQFSPPATDLAIRDTLSQARAPLVYNVGGINVLIAAAGQGAAIQQINDIVGGQGGGLGGAGLNNLAPQLQFIPGVYIDADNGPKPVVHSVTPILGESRTWLIDFSVEAFLNECGDLNPPANAILSHRWKMTHDIGEDGLTVRTITGHAIFRTDRLQQIFNQNPQFQQIPVPGVPNQQMDFPVAVDQFRQWLIHPIPANFRRELVRVTPTEDGSSVEYVVRDIELPMNLAAQGAYKVELRHFAEIEENFGEAIKTSISAVPTAFGAGAAAAAVTAPAGPEVAIPVGIGVGLLTWLGTTLFGNGSSGKGGGVLPVTVIGVVCRVWGTRAATRMQLQNLGIQLATARFDLSFQALGQGLASGFVKQISGKRIRIEHDAAGKYIDVVASIRSQILGSAVLSNGGFTTLPGVHLYFPSADDTASPSQPLPGLMKIVEDFSRLVLHDSIDFVALCCRKSTIHAGIRRSSWPRRLIKNNCPNTPVRLGHNDGSWSVAGNFGKKNTWD